MTCSRIGLSLFLAALAASWSAPVKAGFIVTNSGFVQGTTVVFNQNGPGNPDQVVGYRFTVGANSLSVTGLGDWDHNSDGLPSPILVGLWDSNGNLLASVTIPASTSGALRDTDYRFVDLTSAVTLQSGQTYTIGDRRTQGSGTQTQEDLQGEGNTPTVSTDVTFNGTYNTPQAFDLNTTPFSQQMPTQFLGGSTLDWVGPNIEYTALATTVPEPSSVALLCLGAGGVTAYTRRRRKATV
jgi:hypothetical protein